MLCEIFTADPTLNTEDVDTLKALATDLGLTKVADAVSRKDLYRPATPQELRVYGVLLTSHVKLDEYNAVIPTRVLEVFKEQRENFDEFYVWYETNSRDPILVANRKEQTPGGWGHTVQYILARWGEELESFETLAHQAALKWAAKRKHEILEGQAKLASALKELDDKPEMLAQSPSLGTGCSVYL